MRKIILSLAISLDGYISDDKGNYDWIVGHDDKSNDSKNTFDYDGFINDTDVVVMGSVAYEDAGVAMFEGKKNNCCNIKRI